MSANGMSAYDAILLNIDACSDSVVGRTVLQKLIYFQTELGVEIDVSYIPHYYGPYSKTVAAALVELVEFGYVYERRSAVYGYAYALTDDGRDIANDEKEKNKVVFERIKEIITKCRDCLKPGPLSYAAKVHYINGIDPTFEPEDIAGMFGWKMNDDKVRMGRDLLKRLDLDKS